MTVNERFFSYTVEMKMSLFHRRSKSSKIIRFQNEEEGNHHAPIRVDYPNFNQQIQLGVNAMLQ